MFNCKRYLHKAVTHLRDFGSNHEVRPELVGVISPKNPMLFGVSAVMLTSSIQTQKLIIPTMKTTEVTCTKSHVTKNTCAIESQSLFCRPRCSSVVFLSGTHHAYIFFMSTVVGSPFLKGTIEQRDLSSTTLDII